MSFRFFFYQFYCYRYAMNRFLIARRTRKALRACELYANFFTLCSPGASTIFGGALLYFGNGKESFNLILDPDADPDHRQNLIISTKGQV